MKVSTSLITLIALSPLLNAQTLAPMEASLEETAAKRWSEMNSDRVAGSANGQVITLSDVRQQVTPFLREIRAKAKTDEEFNKTLDSIAEETLKQFADRQLIIAEFKNSMGKIPESYVDGDIEDTIRRDFGGDRNRFVAALRAQGTTPLAYRRQIEDRIIFDYMIGQVRRTALEVGPGRVVEYFAKHQADFTHKESVKLSQITITQGAAETIEEAKTRANAWVDALKSPEKIAATFAFYKINPPNQKVTLNFAEVAKSISTDDYASAGGDAGWKSIEELNERVAAELRTLKDGETSDALQFDLPGGKSIWFILKRDGFKPAGNGSLDEVKVRSEIEERVRMESMKEAVDKWMGELRAKNHVEFR
jgi:parvulin-like peptidyl-prolyl isomerase